ncbi:MULTISPECIES: MarR family winged helix-turn-helix transcriptional regulator [Corynebacterium]|nr:MULTISPECIES: MarR family transcriptional regulator [Corynebacterium]MDN8624846.1 MarR family transcriptional regulator [Corynebacterium kroppenstedtii]QRQ65556.1 MarR family transcriptional regulator [Corynebacterium kroppenstedtii]
MTSTDKSIDNNSGDTSPVDATPSHAPTQSSKKSADDISIDELAARLRPLFNRLVLIYYRQSVHTTLTAGQISILSVLEQHGSMRISDIAKYESISMPTASNAIHRLEFDGLVVRERDKHDRRGVTVALTEHGQQELDRVNAQRNREFARFISQYTRDGKELALELTDLLERMLNDHEGGSDDDQPPHQQPA